MFLLTKKYTVIEKVHGLSVPIHIVLFIDPQTCHLVSVPAIYFDEKKYMKLRNSHSDLFDLPILLLGWSAVQPLIFQMSPDVEVQTNHEGAHPPNATFPHAEIAGLMKGLLRDNDG